jgi:hypothetical protein
MNGEKGRATIKVRGFSYSLLDKNEKGGLLTSGIRGRSQVKKVIRARRTVASYTIHQTEVKQICEDIHLVPNQSRARANERC